MSRIVKGTVLSGTGRGAKFISLPIYKNIFENLLGKEPFLGTLNIELPTEDAKFVNKKFSEGQVFDNLEYNNKEYGGIITIPLEVIYNGESYNGVGVRPYLTVHDSDVLEIVSPIHLRKNMNLEDGDHIEVKIY